MVSYLVDYFILFQFNSSFFYTQSPDSFIYECIVEINANFHMDDKLQKYYDYFKQTTKCNFKYEVVWCLT